MKNTENHFILERPSEVMRQYIDAVAVFEAYEEAKKEAAQFRGGMYWHKGQTSAPEVTYLVRTSSRGSETGLGVRSPETIAMYGTFHANKNLAEQRLAGLKNALDVHRRMNRALRVGRIAPIIVDILNQLEATKLSEHFRVVGTHALYAYEATAGVFFNDAAVATRDIDLLWNVRNHLAFATALTRVDSSMLGALKKVDPTFRIRNSQKYTAVNKDGFEVDIIRRPKQDKDPHPVKLSEADDDFWVAQAPRAHLLQDSPSFSAVIVATDGTMARMNTLNPASFIQFREWLSTLPERDALKRRRDSLQARAVEYVVKEYLPHLATK